MQGDDRAAKIDRACQWYRSNRDAIASLLGTDGLYVPAEDGHGIHYYQPHWNPECWIEKWEERDRRFSLEEAEEKIGAQMRPLFKVVRDRQFGVATEPHPL